MICPACRKDMMVVEYKGIELDYCIACHGVWFDAGELELLLKSLGLGSQSPPLDSLLAGPQPGHAEKSRRCPLCRSRMRKTSLGGQPVIIIDACQHGDGLWFDGGELDGLLDRMAPQPQTETARQVVSFLREVFQGAQPVSQHNMEV